jgi:hypothetical protein
VSFFFGTPFVFEASQTNTSMKKYVAGTALLLIGFAGQNQIAPSEEVLYKVEKHTNNAFTFGEKLSYKVHYGLLNGGQFDFTVGDQPKKVGDKSTYYLRVFGKSTGMVDLMFGVRDEFESYMDVDALLPWQATKKIKEGDYKDSDFIIFDHERRKANSRRGQLDIPANTHDIVSAIYYARTTDMSNAKPGDVFPINFYLDHKNYEFRFKFIGRELIETELGTFNALKIKPQVVQGRVFKDSEAITMWVTDDENHIPLRAQSEIWVGSLKADLVKMSGIRNPLTSKRK